MNDYLDALDRLDAILSDARDEVRRARRTPGAIECVQCLAEAALDECAVATVLAKEIENV